MAEPARRNAAGPAAPGWGEYRRAMMARAQEVAAAVTAYLADDEGTGLKAAIAALAIAALIEHGTAARQADFGAAVIEEACARAVAEDRAAAPRPRGYPLRAV